jgi:hypothetical protein
MGTLNPNPRPEAQAFSASSSKVYKGKQHGGEVSTLQERGPHSRSILDSSPSLMTKSRRRPKERRTERGGGEELFSDERRRQSEQGTKGRKFCLRFDAELNTGSLNPAGLSLSLPGPNKPERFNNPIFYFSNLIQKPSPK